MAPGPVEGVLTLEPALGLAGWSQLPLELEQWQELDLLEELEVEAGLGAGV